MNAIHDKEKPMFSFSQPATYEIRVLGKIPEFYAESFSDNAYLREAIRDSLSNS